MKETLWKFISSNTQVGTMLEEGKEGRWEEEGKEGRWEEEGKEGGWEEEIVP